MYTQNRSAARYVRQKLKRERDKSSIIVGDFNTPLSAIYRARQKIRYKRTQQHIQPTRSNQYLWNTPPNNGRIHIFFKGSWNIYQDRSCRGL